MLVHISILVNDSASSLSSAITTFIELVLEVLRIQSTIRFLEALVVYLCLLKGSFSRDITRFFHVPLLYEICFPLLSGLRPLRSVTRFRFLHRDRRSHSSRTLYHFFLIGICQMHFGVPLWLAFPNIFMVFGH